MINPDHIGTPAATEYATVYLVFELSKATWKLGLLLPGSQKLSRYSIPGGDLKALTERLTMARAKAASGGKPVRIVSCYEAGFDAHWLHRWLTDHDVTNYEVDPASIAVNRRARRVKTDNIDLDQLMRTLLAYLRGEPRVCSMVHVPAVEDEDRKRLNREREYLKEEQTAHTNRIKGLLHAQGVRNVMPLSRGFIAGLDKMRTGDGRPLPERLKTEIVREHERLSVVLRQINEIEAKSRAELRAAKPASPEAKTVMLAGLKGIGMIGGQKLVNEAFYRSFDNRRQVGSYFGLTGTPFNSGTIVREQGISKSGNARARTVAIELAWFWVQHQPESELTRWFQKRVGNLKGRPRRVAIVALARKLMVALWRYLTLGLIPTGAVMRPSL
ncbi:MAG TPA: IS110 family transposase [Xanthobacteraceae bacterium]|jgi:transposase